MTTETEASSPSQEKSLSKVAMSGGIYLLGRQVISIFLKLIGVILITRILGPSSYGAYVSAFNIYVYATLVGQFGLGVYILRQEGVVSEELYRTAYTILAGITLTLMAALLLGLPALTAWVNVDGFPLVLTVLVFALPFQLLTVPAMVQLERALNFRAVATLEIAGQLGFYAFAIPAVMLGWGPASLAAGWLVQQALTCIGAHVVARRVPRFGLDFKIARDMVGYSATFSFANWIWQLRMLVNPLIVAPVMGAQVVGLVGMTISLLEMLSIIKTIVWRLSIPILGRIQSDMAKLRRGVTEGMELQGLAIGTILLGFGWLGYFIVPVVFGPEWLPVMDIYPFVALAYYTNALFNMHSSVLSLLRKNMHVAVFHLVHIAIFAGTAIILVPRIGAFGYGYAEIAALVSYVALHGYLTKAIGSPNYSPALVWWVGVAIGLFWQTLGLWAILAPFVALAIPPSPQRIAYYVRRIRER